MAIISKDTAIVHMIDNVIHAVYHTTVQINVSSITSLGIGATASNGIGIGSKIRIVKLY